eukprot:scaffold6916_cov119-Isochrysis_galbana.AAC.6
MAPPTSASAPDGRSFWACHRRRSDRARKSSLRCAERHNLGPGCGLAATSPSTYALLWSH